MNSPIEISNGQDTVKIYRGTSRGRPYFQLSFYRAGQRERRTFSNQKTARREAKVILGQLATNSEVANESMSVSDIESLVAARTALEGIALPLHLAVEGFTGAVKQLGMPSDPLAALHRAVSFYVKHHPVDMERVSLGEMAKRYIASRKRVGLSKYRISAIGVATKALFKKFSAEDCDFPSGTEVVKWLDEKYESTVTKNSHMKTLKAFVAWAKKEQLIVSETISAAELWKDRPGKIEIYTPEEIRCILKKVPSLVPFVAIGAFAGLRCSEILKLDWSEINFERGFIMVAATKTKSAARRLVPIQENLKAWLKPHAKKEGLVVPLGDSRIAQILRGPGLPRKRNAFRHSYISYRVAEVNDTPRVALEAGNSPAMIFKHYRELVGPDEAKEWFGIMPDGVTTPESADETPKETVATEQAQSEVTATAAPIAA